MRASLNLRRALTASLATTALVAGSLAMGAAPAMADGGSTSVLGAYNGTIGVPQSLTIQVTNDAAAGIGWCAVPTMPTVTVFGNGQALGTATFQSCAGNSVRTYTFNWVPASAMKWNLYAEDDAGALPFTSPTVSISQVQTKTSVSAPNTAKIGAQATISATVTPTQGMYAPIGNVQFAVNGQNVGSPVFLGGSSPATAQYQWTPMTGGTFTWTATYTPGPDRYGVVDAACGNTCVSQADYTVVSSQTVRVYLANPPQFYANTANTLTAVVSVIPPTGSVTFLVNGGTVATNVPVQANGLATTSWTPPAAGNYVVTANWIGNTGITGQAQETVAVAAASPAADSIVVVASGRSWVPGTYNAANGTNLAFAVTTASGAAATVAEAGPCQLAGNTLIVNQGNGQCRVTVSSPGAGSFSANSVQFTLNLVPGQQSATVAAPASGRVNKGKSLTLESAAQGDTNAGQNIVWKITKGKNKVCKLTFPSSGAVKLKIVGKGYCTVKGSAPGISGQWAAYSTTRTYQGV